MALSLSLSELAARIDGTILCGNQSSVFFGMDALDSAGPDDISFLGNERYLNHFLNTKAGAVIVPKGYDFTNHQAALVAVDNPTLAFSFVIKHFARQSSQFTPGIHPRAFVSPSAVLDPAKVAVAPGAIIMEGASIGDGSYIGPNAVISPYVSIGNDCIIHPNVTIADRSIIGSRVIIHSGSVIGSDGFGYEFSNGRHIKIDQVGIVVIGDDVEIGSNTSVDRARFGKTTIGDGTKIDNLVQIAHNVTIGKHCLIVSQSGVAGSTKLEDYVTVAAQVGIVGHITIGSQSILSARTGATTNLDGGITYGGNPALPIAEHTKNKALVRRLPKLLERIKRIEKQLDSSD